MFNEENLHSLFRDTSRWGMAVAQGTNCVWVIRRHNWDDDDNSDFRFTIDQDIHTLYERVFPKVTAKQDLIEFLKVVNLWENK
jgi:hypothetical protein